FGLDGPQRSLRQVGATLGVSGERIRQVERVALDKLREAALAASVEDPGPAHPRPANTQRPSAR
ncbi:MAG: sigma factor-like helix-turn-helix DNA-binding protein, partial [Solirubrobacteraceae bacterium]